MGTFLRSLLLLRSRTCRVVRICLGGSNRLSSSCCFFAWTPRLLACATGIPSCVEMVLYRLLLRLLVLCCWLLLDWKIVARGNFAYLVRMLLGSRHRARNHNTICFANVARIQLLVSKIVRILGTFFVVILSATVF